MTITIGDSAPPPPPPGGGGGGSPPGGGTLPTVQFASSSLSCKEACGTCKVTVTLSAASMSAVTVKYATKDGTSPSSALAGSDYVATSGTLTFAMGETSKTIDVPVINDSAMESNEVFGIELSEPSGATLSTPSNVEVTIIDDDTGTTGGTVAVSATGGVFSPDPAPIGTEVSATLTAKAVRPTTGTGSFDSPTWDWKVADSQYSETSESGPWNNGSASIMAEFTPLAAPGFDGVFDYSAVALTVVVADGGYWQVSNEVKAAYTDAAGKAANGSAIAQAKGVEFAATMNRRYDGNTNYDSVKQGEVKDVLVGTIIDVLVLIVPEDTKNLKFQWDMPPGKIFSDYLIGSEKAVLFPVLEKDLAKDNLRFYWSDAGDNRIVKCSIASGNISKNLQVEFNVKKPTCDPKIDVQTGEVQHDKEFSEVIFKNTGKYSEGIQFSTNVKVPVGFPQGQWQYVQTVESARYKIGADGKKYRLESNGEVWLDKSVSYPSNAGPFDPKTKPAKIVFQTGELGSAGDSPREPLPLIFSMKKLWIPEKKENYRMYVMFKPAGAKSKWVPLQSVAWDWSFTAEYDDNKVEWTVKDMKASPPVVGDNSAHPVWENLVQSAGYKEDKQ